MTIRRITKRFKGFTIVELVVVVAIIGVLAAIGIFSYIQIESSVRNSERSTEISVLASALEKYYDNNGEYPDCSVLSGSNPTTVSSTVLRGLDPNALTAPNAPAGTNSITCVSPIANTYAYLGGGLNYTLSYKEEGSGNIISVNSKQQSTGITYALTLTADTGGTVSKTGTSPYSPGDTPTITATASTYYVFSGWAESPGCSGIASHTIVMDTIKSCVASFTPIAVAVPTAPTVTVTQPTGSTTAFSWGAASCPGNTARYQYRYTINSSTPYDSGLVATALTSFVPTTSTENLTYTVAVQAECYNAATSSGMSTTGSASYYRPFSLTLTAGAGGTVSGGGSYNAGTTPTITATANAGYIFNSWTGSTGCSGVASHTITMDDTKSCTANFIVTYTLTLTAGTGGTVAQSGTSPYDTGSTPTITASANAYYTFSSWTGDTGCSGTAAHAITMTANKSCTASFVVTTIAAPATPTVTPSTVGATTTWSWGAASCPGNTARYQYRYTISSGYDSGLVATAATSVAFTTSTEGLTYTVAVQAQCYNAVGTSGWSAAGSAGYTRPIPTVTVVSQTWMLYNLNVGTKLNPGAGGTPQNGIVEKWCYSGLDSNCTTYGGLYAWNEAMNGSTVSGAQGACPTGFHVPTDAEFVTLEQNIGMAANQSYLTGDRGTNQGLWLRTGGYTGWNTLYGGVTATFGSPSFFAGDDGFYWTSSEYGSGIAWARMYHSAAKSDKLGRQAELKGEGYSVRCIMN